jgi:hypothetical protein
MERKNLFRLAVLLEISDDYEEPTHIYRMVAQRLGICEIVVNPEEVQASLIGLVELGLARAHRITGIGPVEDIQGVPAIHHLQDLYFWITDEGRAALAVWRHEWPLDDEDELLPGWSPPSR